MLVHGNLYPAVESRPPGFSARAELLDELTRAGGACLEFLAAAIDLLGECGKVENPNDHSNSLKGMN
jgi:hypothetical protein